MKIYLLSYQINIEECFSVKNKFHYLNSICIDLINKI
ncbi:hypothetical protein MEG1DRAFT_00222 [Photorhabdus temperata subsp. temperata Meg1]|uniref:Uncharacterized protein n=1 Tax=Photorhabdus temperata subsp. temperata Meg1 TaxID=1393735 RepID=A0A081S2F8_PHOTE|nr:hypothetical protein MEG1DRAFT_00222 [Photorhabdus temperata subsp. temperata Meg1]